LCTPKDKEDAQLQVPPAETNAVQIVAPPSLTVTVAPGSPEPEMPGFGATVLLAAGEMIIGASTTVSFDVLELAVIDPAMLV
jgi:cystathionine beta-lyase family protein involved in aluminum resistance